MCWFRSNVRFGICLALIALALQLVLTFGHVHAPSATSINATLSSDVATSSGAGSHDPAHNGLADRDCPTCALIHLSSAATPSLAPNLPLRASVDFITLRPHAESFPAASPHFQAKARSPPFV
jgi:hypothetical protein